MFKSKTPSLIGHRNCPKNEQDTCCSDLDFRMVFPQIIAGFHALVQAIGLPINLLVIVTIALERRFHVMRYILLASLASSDFLILVLVNSLRIGSIAQERWLYGQTMCDLNPFFMRYFHFNTILLLIAISYERYCAIVKSPMTYDGTITKSRVGLMIFVWVAPIPLSIGPFVGWGQYVYNPEVFSCEQGWGIQNDSTAKRTAIFAIIFLAVPSLIIVFLNWSVFQTAKSLQQNVVQVGNLDGSVVSENQLQEMARNRSERKAAVDVCIVIAAFMVCFLPVWTVGLCRQFLKNSEVPSEVILATNVIFLINTLCNSIIYSIRKRDFRAGVKNVFRRMGGQCGSLDDTNNNQIDMNNITVQANIGTGESATRLAVPQSAQDSPPTAPQSAQNNQIGMNNITVRAKIGTGESTTRLAVPQSAQDSPPTAPQSAHNNQIDMDNITIRANIGRGESTGIPTAPQSAQDSPSIASQSTHNNHIGMNIMVQDNIDASQSTQDQGVTRITEPTEVTLQSGRLPPIEEIIKSKIISRIRSHFNENIDS